MSETINNSNKWLFESYASNVTSQRGEDGIIQKILEVLDIKDGWCVDVGAYGMDNSNTYVLFHDMGWKGI